MNAAETTLLTKADVARRLQCTERHVDNLMRSGLPYVRVGARMVRFDGDAIREWLDNNTSSFEAAANA